MTLAALVERANGWGFATDKLIYVDHRDLPLSGDRPGDAVRQIIAGLDIGVDI